MSLADERNELFRAHMEFSCTQIRPRSYRQKVGRKLEYINPWTSITEREMFQQKAYSMWRAYLQKEGICYQLGLAPLPIELLYEWRVEEVEIAKDKFDKRYIRNTPEEIKALADRHRELMDGLDPLGG